MEEEIEITVLFEDNQYPLALYSGINLSGIKHILEPMINGLFVFEAK